MKLMRLFLSILVVGLFYLAVQSAERTVTGSNAASPINLVNADSDSVTSAQIYNDDGVFFLWLKIDKVSGTIGACEFSWRVSDWAVARWDPIYIDTSRTTGAPYGYVCARNAAGAGLWITPIDGAWYRAVLFDPASPAPHPPIPEGSRIVFKAKHNGVAGVVNVTRVLGYEQVN